MVDVFSRDQPYLRSFPSSCVTSDFSQPSSDVPASSPIQVWDQLKVAFVLWPFFFSWLYRMARFLLGLSLPPPLFSTLDCWPTPGKIYLLCSPSLRVPGSGVSFFFQPLPPLPTFFFGATTLVFAADFTPQAPIFSFFFFPNPRCLAFSQSTRVTSPLPSFLVQWCDDPCPFAPVPSDTPHRRKPPTPGIFS